MKLKFLLEDVTNFVCGFLEDIGSVINKTPTKDELKRVTQSPKFRPHVWEKQQKPLTSTLTSAKFLRISRKPKGAPNTDAQIFNHPRR